MNSVGYEERLIVFIDILGFKNMVNESEHIQEKFNKVLEFISDLQKSIVRKYEFENYHEESMRMFRKDNYINPSKFDYAMFSDSIIISLNFKEAQSLVNIVSTLGLLQSKFMAKGILIRGGITYGKIYHDSSVCFGPGFVKAVELEKQAKYPRILIDKDILDGTNIPPWDKPIKEMYSSLINPWLEQDINPIAIYDNEIEYYYVNPLLTHNSHDYYEDIINSIETNISLLEASNAEKSIIEKWIWIKEDLARNPKVVSGLIKDKFFKD